MSDHYATLGVRRNASSQDIKRAYWRLVQNYHPDKLPPGTPELVKRDAAEKFLIIQNAFDVLSSSDRFSYDRSLDVEEVPWSSPTPTPSPPPAPPPPTPSPDIYCRDCGSRLEGSTCPRCTKQQSSVLYRFRRGWSNYQDFLGTHPSVVLLWILFFLVGLVGAIIIPQSGLYADGKPWDAAVCSGFLVFYTTGLVITIFKKGIAGVWRGVIRLCSTRPFTGTLAVQLTILVLVALIVGATQPSATAPTLPASAALAPKRAVQPTPQAAMIPPTPARSASMPISGQFMGGVVNTTANLGASAELALQQTSNRLTGCFVVFRPLYGSGKITGSVHGAAFELLANSPLFDIRFTGREDGESLSGTYVVERGGTGTQNGSFTFSRSRTPLADGLKSSDCRND
jgi:hypothetical protein